ncbi:hypothetical protein PPNK14_25510 [Pectobacterium parmentieri]
MFWRESIGWPLAFQRSESRGRKREIHSLLRAMVGKRKEPVPQPTLAQTAPNRGCLMQSSAVSGGLTYRAL